MQNVVKYTKYSLAKFAYFQYICITCGNCHHFRLKNGNNFACNTNILKICKLRKAIFSVNMNRNIQYEYSKVL
jgi:hypothetical protein